MHTHTANICNRHNAILSDAQSRGEYFGGYHICIGEKRYSLSIGVAPNEEERGEPYSPTKSDEDDVS